MDARALIAQIDAGAAPPIVDVRSRAEYVRGHVPGALHIPFWLLPWRRDALPEPRDEPIVVYCGHGPRAYIAGAILRWHGFRRVRYLPGHFAGWRRAGLREETD